MLEHHFPLDDTENMMRKKGRQMLMKILKYFPSILLER